MSSTKISVWFSVLLLLMTFLAACGGGDSTAQPATPATHTWAAAKDMQHPRSGHTATLLPNGKVLVVGGESSNPPVLASAELYDPSTGAWTATASMSTPRFGHSATLLANGNVLVVGGAASVVLQGPVAASEVYAAEIYDVGKENWSVTGSTSFPHVSQTAVLLPNGSVLVAGETNHVSAEIYEPSTGVWLTASSPGGDLSLSRDLMTLLPDGKVLGVFEFVTALLDPSTGSWTPTNPIPPPPPGTARAFFNLTALNDGRALIAGAVENEGSVSDAPFPVPYAFVYDSSTNTWSPTGDMMMPRQVATASLLKDGSVLVFGGTSDVSSELFDPSTGTWSLTGNMVTFRSTSIYDTTATVLPDGRVLVAGGIGKNNEVIAGTEIYTP